MAKPRVPLCFDVTVAWGVNRLSWTTFCRADVNICFPPRSERRALAAIPSRAPMHVRVFGYDQRAESYREITAMKPIIVTSVVLLACGAGHALAACPTTNLASRVDMRNLLSGHYACATRAAETWRSEERRVGKEWRSQGRRDG